MFNTTNESQTCCPMCYEKGLLLPILNESTWSAGVRAFFYLGGMIWCFLGVAIVSDTFMCGIEHITSKTRTITIPNSGGQGFKVIEVKVWNDTVANLTLLAFGTSAPEILLNVIETCGHTFEAGELGPGTIVGSAAFNLFVITAICIVCIPNGETRQMKNLTVFAVTSIFGIFAYIWLILVLLVISPEVVELWEAILTFLMFPVLILSAYVADRGLWCAQNRTASEVEIGLELGKTNKFGEGTADIIEVARKLARDPAISEDEVAQAMASEIAKGKPKPSSWYRVNATRFLTGGHKMTQSTKKGFDDLLERVHLDSPRVSQHGDCVANGTVSARDSALHPKKAVVEFTAATCTVLENEGYVRIGVKRSGDLSKEIKIGIETIDGTAEATVDYKPVKQMITFGPEETTKEIFIDIVDDDVWEPDEFFYVRLFHHTSGSTEDDVTIGKLGINQVTIVNDDEPGKLEFNKPSYVIKESSNVASLEINRVNGADAEVTVTWKTHDMTARTHIEYAGGEGKVVFKHGETSKSISIEIFGIKDKQNEPNFQVELLNPTGGAEIGKISKTVVTLINDEEFENMLKRIAIKTKKNLDGLKLDAGSWREQFVSALNVNGGDLENATSVDYILHFITFFWKVLFACLPPPSMGGGWLTFLSSLLMIGLLTAIVSDLASIFGCLVGLSDYITAITFVAMGTSMPDTFASKSAAIHEKWADSSIGNINGSNSVNVFLGLGLPWLLACVYWKVKGKEFHHPTGTMGLSVTIFAVCAILLIIMLVTRRQLPIFGKAELGGPKTFKYLTGMIALVMWVLYVIVSSLQAQGYIDAF